LKAACADHGKRISRCQRNELFAPAEEEWISGDDQPSNLLLGQACENSIEVAFAACVQRADLANRNSY